MACLCCGANLLFAQEKQSFTLKEAQAYAQENSMAAKSSTLEKRTYKQRALDVVTAGFPDLYTELVYQNNFKLPTSLMPESFINPNAGEDDFFEVSFGTKHNANFTIGASMPLIDGRYFVGLAARKTLLDFAGVQHETNLNDLNFVVADAYYSAVVAEEQKAILQKSKAALGKTLNETKALFENGFAESLDVDRLQLSFSNLKADLAAAERQAALALFVLKYQMGLPLEEEIELSEKITDLVAPENLSLLSLEFDPAQRIEHRMLSLFVALKEMDVKQRKAAFFPSLASFANYDFSAQRTTFNLFDFSQPWFESGMWGIQLNVPLFDGFKSGAVLQKTNLELLQRRQKLESFERDAKLQVITAQANFNNALEKLESEQANRQLAEKIYAKAVIKYKEGVGSSIELSAAESDMIGAQGRYIGALYELLSSKNEVSRATGKSD